MFRIASNQFGYLMFASQIQGAPPWSDKIDEAYLYDERDSRTVKLGYWKANAKSYGLDPNCVQIVEA